MLVFGVGATVTLASTFFAYLRRTLRLQAPERVPLRTGLWWLSVLAVIAGAACFLVGLSMTGRAVLPELKAAVTSGSEIGGDKRRGDDAGFCSKREKGELRRDAHKAVKRDKDQTTKGDSDEETEDTTQNQPVPEGKVDEPDSDDTPTKAAPTDAPGGPQPLTRAECENAGSAWNESTNTCGQAAN